MDTKTRTAISLAASSAKALEFLSGLGTLDERMLILVALEKLMSSEDMGLVQKLAA
ncbi:hypothetical protein SAMN05216344_11980 [Polaromonas sp. OV174]|nr:hypothetical protein SAMN05216344_11980 [Polaromonas sp. OV174]